MAQQYQLSDKQKMLAMALHARQCRKETTLAIILKLENDDQIDDMVWFMSQNPTANDEKLIAVAYQLVKEAHQ